MYTFSARVSLVYSYNRNTRCSEARPLTTDGLATHLACCAVQRQCSVSSCCSRPVSDSDQCLLVQHAVHLYIIYSRCATLPTQWLAVTSCTMN